MDELLSEFLAEARESLALLDESLLALERHPDDAQTLAVVFRLFHSIKGTCGFLNLPRLERVAHAAEDLLGALRSGGSQSGTAITPGLITLILAAVDRIKLVVDGIADAGTEPGGDDTALLATLAATTADPTASAPDESPPQPHPKEEEEVASPGQSIRVYVSALETLMTLVSELVLTRNQLMQIARTEVDSRYYAPLQRLSHLTSDLQEGVMRTRMQPIRHAWSAMPRLVRDLAGELGKQIAVAMHGEDTELDRHVLELIRSPLTHMVRNCADHGLETPAARLAAGKPARGTITLNSYHEGGTIVIEVGDDGAGLDTARIRDRAVAKGLVTPAQIADWTDSQLNRLIFLPGLTTAASVTSISGRGVGMDVVQTNIDRLAGTVEVRSIPGQGTDFTIRIPLTLAIISALVVDAGGQRFALPQTCVAELVQIDEGEPVTGQGRLAVERVDGAPVLRLRDKLLPLVCLASLLQLPDRPQATGSLTVVVVQLGGLQAGLLVDEVFDTEEIVVKPASRMLRHITVFSGATILGDGSVIMILDPSGVARAIGQTAATAKHATAELAAPSSEQSGDHSAMLLVRLTSTSFPVAVPLSLVARIERIGRDAILHTQERAVVRYRGRIMPLVAPAGEFPECETVPVLVFTDQDRSVGLVVAAILDVVSDRLTVELTARAPGMLGTALIAGQVTDVLDTSYWLARGRADWFIQRRNTRHGVAAEDTTRLLVVEDSAFFRQLLVPALSASGYHVTAVDSAARALALLEADQPARFDAIISDIEMPGMDGLALAHRLRTGGRWQETPLLALSGRCSPADVERGLQAGFNDYIAKFDRDALLSALQRHLGQTERVAA